MSDGSTRGQALRGRWALVTGASSGLGVCFARELAGLGADVVLVARREERLRELAGALEKAHGVEARVFAQDLGAREGPEALFEAVSSEGLTVDVLVNNAGFAVYGEELAISWERERAMLELDVFSLVHLTRLFAAGMVERRFGRILQVASIGAFQPCPTYAAYGAAKAFVLQYGEALGYELRGTGVTCTVLSPGVTATEFFDVAGQQMTWFQKASVMQPDAVARIGVKAMRKGRASVVPGFLNALNTWLITMMPRGLATRLAAATMRAH